MTDANSVPQPPAARPSQTFTLSAGYLAMVGGLLLLIIAVLAALWIRERNRRIAAQREVVQLIEQNERDKRNLAQMMLGAMGRQIAGEAEAKPFQRQDHKPVPVTLDGAKRQAYVLPASGAQRFGFQAGDVIVIEEESPATTSSAPSAPSSAPAP